MNHEVLHKRATESLDEIRAIADRHPSLRVYLIRTDTDGILNLEAAIHDAAPGRNPWVYMCGPTLMMKTFTTGFRKLGISAGIGTALALLGAFYVLLA